jgi:hypothetical protein
LSKTRDIVDCRKEAKKRRKEFGEAEEEATDALSVASVALAQPTARVGGAEEATDCASASLRVPKMRRPKTEAKGADEAKKPSRYERCEGKL